MLKKLGIPILVLAAMLSIAPKPAKAETRFGLYLGAPAPPVYVDPYYDPYYYNPYYAYPPYAWRAPAPYYYYAPRYRGYGRDFDRHQFRERAHGRGHEIHGRGECRGWSR